MGKSCQPLSASYAKIQRAKGKADLIQPMVLEYAQSSYFVRTEQRGEYLYVLGRFVKPIPEEISWETVEAVGHLRDALDKMLIDLVERNGRGTSGVGFP